VSFNQSVNRVLPINDGSATPYLVQTNYDHWLPDPKNDPRRTVAQDTLAMLGRHRAGTELGVWMTLSTYPVHNPHTMLSCLMGVNRTGIEGYLRRSMIPGTKE
jgi:hypothetical protein